MNLYKLFKPVKKWFVETIESWAWLLRTIFGRPEIVRLTNERFYEPGSGIEMHLGRWYIISDSGSAYHPHGFHSVGNALHYWYAIEREYRSAIDGAIELNIPAYGGAHKGWTDLELANLFLADHLLDFWLNTDREYFFEVQRQKFQEETGARLLVPGERRFYELQKGGEVHE